MNKIDNIFNSENKLSKEEIKRYLKENLNEKENRIIEGKIESDDFNREAMEGFENTPRSIASFEKMEKKLAAKINGFSYGLNGFIFTAIAILIIIASTLLITNNDNSNQNTPLKSSSNVITELTDSAIDVAEVIPEPKQLNASKIIVNSPVKIQQNEKQQTKTIKERTQQEIKMKMREAVKLDVININYQRPLSIINSTHIYVHELLVYNYKQRGSIVKQVPQFELTGLPAAFEEAKNNELELQIHTKETPYFEFLTNALFDFRKNQFKIALKKFKVILKQYPKDINALFYSGLCYYNINKQQKAIEHFSACLNNSYTIFNEEAFWYTAKSLYAKGETKKSKQQLEIIIEKNGFYKKSAESLLKKINS